MDIRKYFKPLSLSDNDFKPKLYTLDKDSWIEQNAIPSDLQSMYDFDVL
jgi:hypothetical protein